MSNLQAIKQRQRTVRSTQQITMAMKMVSSARLHGLQKAWSRSLAFSDLAGSWLLHGLGLFLENWDPYEPSLEKWWKKSGKNLGSLTEVKQLFGGPGGQELWIDNGFLQGKVHHTLLIFGSDRGLSGSFIANSVRKSREFLQRHGSKDVSIIYVGKKGKDLKRHWTQAASVTFLPRGEKVTWKLLSQVREIIGQIFQRHKANRLWVLYGEYENALSQRSVIKQALPMYHIKEGTFLDNSLEALGLQSLGHRGKETKKPIDFSRPLPSGEEMPALPNLFGRMESGRLSFDQPLAQGLRHLFQNFFCGLLSQLLQEHLVSEYSARLLAMDHATNNGEDIYRSLQLEYNRQRQALITREISEIVSGALVVT